MQANETANTETLNMDLLDELIKKENPDEMGLLDLVFIEEILKQRSHPDMN